MDTHLCGNYYNKNADGRCPDLVYADKDGLTHGKKPLKKYMCEFDYAFELQELIEDLFSKCADDEHSEAEMLAKLDGLNWNMMLHPIMDGASPLYEYTVALKNAGDAYRGLPLTEERAIRLYVDTAPASPASSSTTLQRSMELWLLTDMTLLVTSCFRVSSDATVTEYRAVKGYSIFASDFAIDFDEIVMFLKSLCNSALEGGVPFYEL